MKTLPSARVTGSLARELGTRPNQLVLAWLLHAYAPSVIPLTGPRTAGQLEQNLAALAIELCPGLFASWQTNV